MHVFRLCNCLIYHYYRLIIVIKWGTQFHLNKWIKKAAWYTLMETSHHHCSRVECLFLCQTAMVYWPPCSSGSSFVQFFDASSVQMCMEEEDITYRGRKLDVSLALSKKELDGVKQQGPAEKKNLDKRNLLLAKEGGMWSVGVSEAAIHYLYALFTWWYVCLFVHWFVAILK